MPIFRLFAGVAIAASLCAQPSPAPTLPKPLGDYVPCLFDRDQDASLHAQRASRRLIQPLLAEWVLLGYLSPLQQPALATTLSNHDGADFAAVLEQIHAGGILKLPPQITTQMLAGNLIAATNAIYRDLPRDVACSQSVLSWSEAKDAYNRRIADTYLVYQVNVRNLNAQKEFLMQDVQVALDDRQFSGGRDKIIARGVALEGQAFGRRNTVERVLQSIAAIGQPLSVYASGLALGFASLAPDRSDDQMTRFNDTSFSASEAYKIVVPKSGSATFVTYLPFRVFGTGRSSKNWTSAQWTALADSSYVIVSGVHIIEE